MVAREMELLNWLRCDVGGGRKEEDRSVELSELLKRERGRGTGKDRNLKAGNNK